MTEIIQWCIALGISSIVVLAYYIGKYVGASQK